MSRPGGIRLLTAAVFLAGGVTAWAQQTGTRPDAATFPFRDLTRELGNKTTGTYVVAAVSDVLVMETFGRLMDPKLQRILRSADTTVGNLEAVVVDRRDWPHGLNNNFAPRETAPDLAAIGFDLMSGANNHAFDMGEEGSRASVKWMDAAGIPLAGVGPNLTTARMPVFQQTPKGRIAMLGANSSALGAASDRRGNMGGGWGINPLRVATWNVVTPAQLQQLKQLRDSIVARRGEIDPADSDPITIPRDEPNRVQIFNASFMAGPKPGEYHYDVNRADADANLLAIRHAKEYSDFAIFTMHVHQNRYAFQGLNQDTHPPQFVIDFARGLIDNGADMYLGHGQHNLQGIEIYKGRPIFYNLGLLSNHQIQVEGDQEGPDELPPGMTRIEADERDVDRLQRPGALMGAIATSTYQDGRLVEVRLHPVDLGIGKSRPWSKMGIPQTPSPEVARDILTKLQKYSQPFGTTITIENGVGVIRVPPEAIVPIGGNIRSTFKQLQ